MLVRTNTPPLLGQARSRNWHAETPLRFRLRGKCWYGIVKLAQLSLLPCHARLGVLWLGPEGLSHGRPDP